MLSTPSSTAVLFRLDELAGCCQIVAEHLVVRDEANRRVQWDLAPRLIRYYTTLGLIDRAQQMVGRTAYYGLRHILQILAIKKLQTRGHKLEEVQQNLLGRSDVELEELLQLPSGWTSWLPLLQPPGAGLSSPPPPAMPRRSRRQGE